MAETLQILLIALAAVGILAAGRLYFVLGDVRRVLGNVEQTLETTRQEVTGTLQRLEAVAETTERTLREEVVPTLQVTRQTLANVEVTTRALADTTQAARRLTQQAEGFMGATRLLSAGGAVARAVAQKSAGGLLSGLAAGVGAGVRSLFARKKPEDRRAALKGPERKALPQSPENAILYAPTEEQEPASAGRSRRK